MKKLIPENLSNPKNIENDENTQKEVQEEIKKVDKKDESKISLTPSITSQKKEDILDSYPKEDSNLNLYNEFDNFCDNKRDEEDKTCEITETKEETKIESTKNDFQQDVKTIFSPQISLKEKNKSKDIITISLYKQKIEKIIKIKSSFLFQKKKKYSKQHFYEILKVNNLEEYIVKIEIALKEEKAEYKDKAYDEADENSFNNDSSFIYTNINEIINENMNMN